MLHWKDDKTGESGCRKRITMVSFNHKPHEPHNPSRS